MLNTVSHTRAYPQYKAGVASKPSPSLNSVSTQDSFQLSSVNAESVQPQAVQQFSVSEMSAEKAIAAATNILKRPSVNIKDVQSQLKRELSGVKVKFLHTDKFGELNGRLATEKELVAMIESFKDESDIPFGYIKDGCYARAHLMDESFRQHGINMHKMFCRGDLAASNKHMNARWWYHVAPLVFVDDGQGNPEAKIIDPGFSNKPMNPEDWVKAMNQGSSVEIDLVCPEQYYPRNRSKPDTFSESLPPAVSRMQKYSKKLHDHRVRRGEDLGEYQKPSWDQPGCGGDFVVDGECKTVFPEGVESGPTRIYFGKNGIGTLIAVEPREEEEVSAAWENRPAGFDPNN